jgi:feruloyl-CoA synthase
MSSTPSRRSVVIDRRPDGTVLARSSDDLGPYAVKMTERLDYWASHASYRTFLAQRDSNGRWRNVTYAEAQYFARRIGQALLNRGLSVERPIVILSGNDIEHALLGLAAMYAGIPYTPVSETYSLSSTDFNELRYIFKLLTPGLVFASHGERFEPAVRAVVPEDTEFVANENPTAGATMFADLVNTEPGESIDHAHSHVHADTVFKILFTADATATPKGVILTNRMWCSSQEQARAVLPLNEPAVMVDSLPWSEVLGGNANLGMVLYNGGSLYIDQGIRNVKVMSPTIYVNEARGFEVLIRELRNDPAFQKRFFSRLKLLYCGGADFSGAVWEDLSALSAQERVLLLAGQVSAETTSHTLLGLPAIPVPGLELKLVPSDARKFEVRVRGPNVTWGYWRRLDQTRSAIDEEGFFKLGEYLRFADESDPSRGFVLGS